MASSGAQSIAIDECMALDQVGEMAREHGIGFLGNLHVSTVLFEESEEGADDVRRCLEQGGSLPGYVFGLGGPIVQHINPSRLQSAVAAFLASRKCQGETASSE